MDLELSTILAADDRARVIWQLFGPTAGTVAAIIMLVWVVMRIGAWSREGEDPTTEMHDMLTHYRELHEQGELTDEEFKSIKLQLIGLKPGGITSVNTPQQPELPVPTEPSPDKADETEKRQEA